MNNQSHWQTVYETKGDNDVSWFQEKPQTSLDLISRSGVSKNAAIIDVGGGNSRLVDWLLDAGYLDLSVLDISESVLLKTRARLGSPEKTVGWHVADIRFWSPLRRYDLWHDRATFHFLTDDDDRKAYVDVLSASVNLGGQVVIGTFAKDGPERCSGLLVRRYNAEDIQVAFGPHFHLVESVEADHRTPSGNIQKFQFCRLLYRGSKNDVYAG